jgi:hypothetical protein
MNGKDNLRQWCIDEYGIEFAILYDKFNSDGIVGVFYDTTSGRFYDTISILEMIEKVKKLHTHKNIFQRLKERGKTNDRI